MLQGGSEAGIAAPIAHRRKARERASWIIAALAALAAIGSGHTTWHYARKQQPALISWISRTAPSTTLSPRTRGR